MFDTVAIEPQGRIQDSMFGGGGAIFKTWNIFMRAQKMRSHARAWGGGGGGRYELGTLSHTENNSNLYSGS